MAEEYPMTRREDIQPFLFPSPNCKQVIFHGLYEQPYGFGVGLVFMKRPLWSSKKGYQVVCENGCAPTVLKSNRVARRAFACPRKFSRFSVMLRSA
jgi:hypothetical protein